tara:strand:- start:979 stop:1512 length:534 start_codon:yes stop_codon:yes gene_type:complete
MILLIVLAFIACVAPSVGCFLTLNAKIKELTARIQNDRVSTGKAVDSLLEAITATFQYVRAVDRGDSGTYLRMELNQIRTDFELAFSQLDERLLELEYPGIREAQAYDERAAAEEARFHEESAMDAAPVQCLRDYLTSVGKENLMTHADLLKDVEQLFEKLGNTATRVEELEEKGRG